AAPPATVPNLIADKPAGAMPAADPAGANTPAATASEPAVTPTTADVDLVIVPMPAAAPEARPVRVLMDGKAVVFTPEPYMRNGHTMVALRGLIAQAGTEKLRWDNSAKQATATVGNALYLFTPDQRLVLRNGEALTLAQPLTLADGRLFIPATAWRDLFDGGVVYNPATKEVLLRTTDRTLARLAK
ncbi:MAG TPA: copper amine oxidase N-terminal domain-containing protein, partial [Armatimonadota bacterium]|nr:copper amine oxidase N-terminal domain-containing protein [Armatimonadota bacterium]